MQVATNGIVTNEYNQVLLIRRNDTRTMAPPGGSVDEGELPIDNVTREVREETGLIVMPVRLVGLYFWDTKSRGMLTFVFRCIQRGGELATSEESPVVGFYPASPLPNPMIDFHRKRLESAFKHLGGPPVWGTHETSWRLRLGRLFVFNVVYRYLNLKRFVLRQPRYQPPTVWQVHAYGVCQNDQGQVLWVKRQGEELWGLPHGRSDDQQLEAPWDSLVKDVSLESGMILQPSNLTGVYLCDEPDHLHLVFTAMIDHANQTGGKNQVETAYFTPGQEPSETTSYQTQWVADALNGDPETVFRKSKEV